MWERKRSLNWNALLWKSDNLFENATFCIGVNSHICFLGHIFRKSKVWSNYCQVDKLTLERHNVHLSPSRQESNQVPFVRYLPFTPLSFLQAGLSFHLITLLFKGKNIHNQFVKSRTFIHNPFLKKERIPRQNNQTYHHQPLWFPAKPSKHEQNTVSD